MKGMKLFRFSHSSFEGIRPGVILSDGSRLDLSGITADLNEEFFASNGIERVERAILSASLPAVHADFRTEAVVARPSKIVCIGLNYHEHVDEMGSKALPEPLIFSKASTALCSVQDPLVIPHGSTKMDYEVELAFVIGRRAKYVQESEAMNHIAGFAIMNDYSERAFQKERGGQFTKGKSADTFGPFGPHLTLAKDIPDPNNLHLWLKVNGELRQSSTTALMIFKVPFILSYLSQFMTLLPGDIVSTGTPGGVAMGMDPPRYLQPGDTVQYGIEGLGEVSQSVEAEG